MKAVVIHAPHDLRVEEIAADALAPGRVQIAIEAGGICGSDLHYYHHGGFGAVRLREPMILGHEIAGTIEAVGEGVRGLAVGDRVAVSPSRPCNHCVYCLEGLQNQCLDMLFYGSAMRMPHVQGAFRQTLVADAAQCHKVADGIPATIAAFAEPLAVTLHAVSRAGSLLGKRVLVTGCGPIGSLVIVAARAHGAREIVATDIAEGALAFARKVGADRAINVAEDREALTAYGANKGSFDVMFEASGNGGAIVTGLEVLRPRGVLVQVGIGGAIDVLQNVVVAKEIEIRGSFRFHEEFGLAVDLLNRRSVDVAPLLSAVFPLDDARAAFDAASNRDAAMKVQLSFV